LWLWGLGKHATRHCYEWMKYAGFSLRELVLM
jgi:hypothetical protein